ncbi:MAG: Rpn family recombination-promoting nuclease/putative transposase [Fibrobacter sp.]|nr:Rpn family recombination-promoting nuclease/putative transposase [Fibrobacter sp.]
MPEYEIKPYEQLDITSNFMFAKVFSNKDVAKDFLQDILKITIDKISVIPEATTQEDPFHKSVRFDVLVREELTDTPDYPESKANYHTERYFDIEMQMVDTGELPKRARYYQSMCDLDAMAKGANYEELQEQYILFICPDDIFGKGLSIYRFQNREETSPNILLGDLCYKNFYIFNKYADIKDSATREYMEYFSTQKHESEKMKRIHELVEKYRLDPIAKKAYMTLEQELNIREKKARKEANKKVAKALLAEGDSIEKVARCTGLTPEEIKAL